MANQNKSVGTNEPGAKEDKKVGQILVESKQITIEQLADAMVTQKQLNSQGKRVFKIGEVLVFKKVITLPQLHEALRAQKAKAELSRISIIEV
ncbi:MAG: hypothetical protein JWQ35_1571, partial [Bacteriovoracaceae bacterium]|nr:hypothetical protein [Bacteriovoracaceae bacterium]